MNRNCISYWYPVLQQTGVPTPKTQIVHTDIDLMKLVYQDDGFPKGFENFIVNLKESCALIADEPPYFLRTGQGSGKHSWKQTCCLTDLTQITSHVFQLIEWSAMVDMIGLPVDVWAVREMLPTEPVAVLPVYGDFPLVKEIRAFIGDGKILCSHPYWPVRACQEGFDVVPENFVELYDKLTEYDERERSEINKILGEVATAFKGDGSWSVDILSTRNGIYVTDMAEADRSFHWPRCPNAKLK